LRLFFKEVYSKTFRKSINKSLFLLVSQEEIFLNMHYHFVCGSSKLQIYSIRVLAIVMDAGIAWHPIVIRPMGKGANIAFKNRDSMIKIIKRLLSRC